MLLPWILCSACASFDAMQAERAFDQAVDVLNAAAPMTESVCAEAKDPEQCVAAVKAARLIIAELEELKERAKAIAEAVEAAK